MGTRYEAFASIQATRSTGASRRQSGRTIPAFTIAMRPSLSLAEIARREESRCALGVSEVAADSRPFLGGIASRDTPGTWASMTVGAGLDHAMVEAIVQELGAQRGADELSRAVEELAAWYASAGIEPRIDCAPFVHRAVLRAISNAGFVVRHFEHVFYRELSPGDGFDAPHPPPKDLEIRVVDRNDSAEVEDLVETVCTGFAPPGTTPTDGERALMRRCVLHPRVVSFAAWLAGRCVGGGCLERLDEIVALMALSVLPEFRRRGIQQALIAARLAHAAGTGATLATIGGAPGHGTERNVRRFGFTVAYTKAALIRPGPGLVGERAYDLT